MTLPTPIPTPTIFVTNHDSGSFYASLGVAAGTLALAWVTYLVVRVARNSLDETRRLGAETQRMAAATERQAVISTGTAQQQAFFRIYNWYRDNQNAAKRERVVCSFLAAADREPVAPGDADEILGWMEFLAIMIEQKAVDPEIAREVLGSFPIRITVATHKYWLAKQNAKGPERRPHYARHLVGLVREWQDLPDAIHFGYGSNEWHLSDNPEQDVFPVASRGPNQPGAKKKAAKRRAPMKAATKLTSKKKAARRKI